VNFCTGGPYEIVSVFNNNENPKRRIIDSSGQGTSNNARASGGMSQVDNFCVGKSASDWYSSQTRQFMGTIHQIAIWKDSPTNTEFTASDF